MSNIEVAVTILNKLKPISDGYIIEAYSNGREQGFCIKSAGTNSLKIAFSENRNSDSIVVYVSVDENDFFSLDGNIPSEKAYNARQYFETENDAVKFIKKYLI